MEYSKRGWTGSGAGKIEGSIYKDKNTVAYKIDANWIKHFTIVNPKNAQE